MFLTGMTQSSRSTVSIRKLQKPNYAVKLPLPGPVTPQEPQKTTSGSASDTTPKHKPSQICASILTALGTPRLYAGAKCFTIMGFILFSAVNPCDPLTKNRKRQVLRAGRPFASLCWYISGEGGGVARPAVAERPDHAEQRRAARAGDLRGGR